MALKVYKFVYGQNITAANLNLLQQNVANYVGLHDHSGNEEGPKQWADFISLLDSTGRSQDANNAFNTTVLDHVRDAAIHRPSSGTSTIPNSFVSQNRMGFSNITPDQWVWNGTYWETDVAIPPGMYNDCEYLVYFQPYYPGTFTDFYMALNGGANFSSLEGVVPLNNTLLDFNIMAHSLTSDGFKVRLYAIGQGTRYSITGRSENVYKDIDWNVNKTVAAYLNNVDQIQAIDNRLYVLSKGNNIIVVFSINDSSIIDIITSTRNINSFGVCRYEDTSEQHIYAVTVLNEDSSVFLYETGKQGRIIRTSQEDIDNGIELINDVKQLVSGGVQGDPNSAMYADFGEKIAGGRTINLLGLTAEQNYATLFDSGKILTPDVLDPNPNNPVFPHSGSGRYVNTYYGSSLSSWGLGASKWGSEDSGFNGIGSGLFNFRGWSFETDNDPFYGGDFGRTESTGFTQIRVDHYACSLLEGDEGTGDIQHTIIDSDPSTNSSLTLFDGKYYLEVIGCGKIELDERPIAVSGFVFYNKVDINSQLYFTSLISVLTTSENDSNKIRLFLATKNIDGTGVDNGEIGEITKTKLDIYSSHPTGENYTTLTDDDVDFNNIIAGGVISGDTIIRNGSEILTVATVDGSGHIITTTTPPSGGTWHISDTYEIYRLSGGGGGRVANISGRTFDIISDLKIHSNNPVLSDICCGLIWRDSTVDPYAVAIILSDKTTNKVYYYVSGSVASNYSLTGINLNEGVQGWTLERSYQGGLYVEGKQAVYFGDYQTIDETDYPNLHSNAYNLPDYANFYNNDLWCFRQGFNYWPGEMSRNAKYGIIGNGLIETMDYNNGLDPEASNPINKIGFICYTRPIKYLDKTTLGDAFTFDPRYVNQVVVQPYDDPNATNENRYLVYTPKIINNSYIMMNTTNTINTMTNTFFLLNDPTIDYIDITFDLGGPKKLVSLTTDNTVEPIDYEFITIDNIKDLNVIESEVYGISKGGTCLDGPNINLDNFYMGAIIPPTSEIKGGWNWKVMDSNGAEVVIDPLEHPSLLGEWYTVEQLPLDGNLYTLRLNLKDKLKELIGYVCGLQGIEPGQVMPFSPTFISPVRGKPGIPNELSDQITYEDKGIIGGLGRYDLREQTNGDLNFPVSTSAEFTWISPSYNNTVTVYDWPLSRGGLWMGILSPPLKYFPKYISKFVFETTERIVGANNGLYPYCGNYLPHYYPALNGNDAYGAALVRFTDYVTRKLMINDFNYYKILRTIRVGKNV